MARLQSGITIGLKEGFIDEPGISSTDPIEFALSGKAFNALLNAKVMRPLLLHTRVFARMVPGDKVKATELHMERGREPNAARRYILDMGGVRGVYILRVVILYRTLGAM